MAREIRVVEMGNIEGLTGAALPNTCPRCGKHSTQPGTPNTSDGRVYYLCPYCGKVWHRLIAQRIHDDDYVRVDLDEGYWYGSVVKVEQDSVLVRAYDYLRWVERWRVIVY